MVCIYGKEECKMNVSIAVTNNCEPDGRLYKAVLTCKSWESISIEYVHDAVKGASKVVAKESCHFFETFDKIYECFERNCASIYNKILHKEDGERHYTFACESGEIELSVEVTN
jgi:hypothetical protein